MGKDGDGGYNCPLCRDHDESLKWAKPGHFPTVSAVHWHVRDFHEQWKLHTDMVGEPKAQLLARHVETAAEWEPHEKKNKTQTEKRKKRQLEKSQAETAGPSSTSEDAPKDLPSAEDQRRAEGYHSLPRMYVSIDSYSDAAG